MPLDSAGGDCSGGSLRPGDEVLAVPAIPGEGRALFAAVSAQGLAGRPRPAAHEPVPAGRRSRLWRFVPVAPEAGAAEDGARADAAGATPEDAGPAPVLALIRRLPLGLE